MTVLAVCFARRSSASSHAGRSTWFVVWRSSPCRPAGASSSARPRSPSRCCSALGAPWAVAARGEPQGLPDPRRGLVAGPAGLAAARLARGLARGADRASSSSSRRRTPSPTCVPPARPGRQRRSRCRPTPSRRCSGRCAVVAGIVVAIWAAPSPLRLGGGGHPVRARVAAAAALPAVEPRRRRPRPRRPMTDAAGRRPAADPAADPVAIAARGATVVIARDRRLARAALDRRDALRRNAAEGRLRPGAAAPGRPGRRGGQLALRPGARRRHRAGRREPLLLVPAGRRPAHGACSPRVPSPVMLVAWDAAAVAGLAAVAVALARRFAPDLPVALDRPAGRRPRPALLPVRDRAAVREPRRVLPAPLRARCSSRGRAGHDGPRGVPGRRWRSLWRLARSRSSTRPSLGVWFGRPARLGGDRGRGRGRPRLALGVGLAVLAAQRRSSAAPSCGATTSAVVRAGSSADLVDPRNAGPAAQLALLVGADDGFARTAQIPSRSARSWPRRDPPRGGDSGRAASAGRPPPRSRRCRSPGSTTRRR